MRFSSPILDDLLGKMLPKILTGKIRISPSRGKARELSGVLLELEQPRARLSRTETRGKPFSSLGEFLWYLSRDNKLEFIRYYILAYDDETEDGETIHGGYGPRLFNQRGNDQLQNAISTLKVSSESRRAVLQLFNAEDIARRYVEIPCTCTIQFLVRQKRLHMFTTMRSNDAYRRRLMLADKVYRLKLRKDVADPMFIALMLNSPQSLRRIEKMKSGISDSGLNLTQDKFLRLSIPVPPVATQQEIVCRVEVAFSRIQKFLDEAIRVSALLERLDQTIISKAFRGEVGVHQTSMKAAHEAAE